MSTETTKHEDLIFDVGMHKGEDADFYLKKGFRVIGFEADPAFVQHCKVRFRNAIEDGRLIIVEGAIVSSRESREGKPTIKFFRNLDEPVWGTALEGWAKRNARLGARSEVIEVKTVDFVSCLRRYGIPYYMKVDIEGADVACLRALLDFEAKPDYVSIESDKRAFAKLEDEIGLLERLGYNMFKAIDQASVPDQVQPKEGVYAPQHSFSFGCSGLFGKELPGAWKDTDALLAEYKRIFILYRLFGDDTIFQKTTKLGRAVSRVAGVLVGRVFLGRRYLVGWYDTHALHSSARQ
jgi:FkbM family methyltransferase